MKKIFLFVGVAFLSSALIAQNVGIGTTTPTSRLEVKNPVKSSVKISSNNFVDTSQLTFSNRNPSNQGTDMQITSIRETGLRVSSSSDLTENNKDTIMQITPTGFVGIRTAAPQYPLDVKGNMNVTGEIKANGSSGSAGDILRSNGNGTMQWDNLSSVVSSSSASSGFGVWGDCVANAVIGAYQPVADTVSSGITEYFGHSVAVSGNFAIVGSPYDINSGNPYGGAHIYRLTGDKWVLMQKIAEGAPWGLRFGYSVSISGNYAVIGVPEYSPTISGNPAPGAVSVYQYNGTNWVFMQRLTDLTGANGDRFGNSVCISGNRIIVGANNDDNGAAIDQGSASIYQFNGSSWVLMQKIIDATGAANDFFGESVSIDRDIVVIGAPYDDNGTFLNQGSATIYRYIGSTWVSSLRTTNPSSAANLYWGTSVSVSGNAVIIGAPNERVGVNSSQGSVSFFDFTGTNWLYGGKLSNPAGVAGDGLGNYVSLSGDYAIVGAQSGNVGTSYQGYVMIFFKYSGNIWQKLITLSDPAGAIDDRFGNSVSIDGINKRFLIGANGFSFYRGKAMFGKVN